MMVTRHTVAGGSPQGLTGFLQNVTHSGVAHPKIEGKRDLEVLKQYHFQYGVLVYMPVNCHQQGHQIVRANLSAGPYIQNTQSRSIILKTKGLPLF